MKIEIIGDAKEIAALVLAVQERQISNIIKNVDTGLAEKVTENHQFLHQS